ncbi:Abscisic acid 8'-hydroxylase 4 [Citrus sinensis]|nr:Abscisic acid 8'-hydroxylase 4 [Citrus sinensis]
MDVFLLYSFFFIILSATSLRNLIKRMSLPKPKLPPGSMGLPYIGETPKLFSQNPDDFFSTRQKRYGEIFKTHILGYKCVMLVNSEAIRYVLVTHAHLFKPTYPRSKERLIGPWALFFHQDGYHTRMRKLVQSSLTPSMVRNSVSCIEATAMSTLDSWSGGRLVNTFHEMKKFVFDVAVLSIFGHLDTGYKEILKKNYSTLDRGYNSFPIYLPGSLYATSLRARRRLDQTLSEIIKERKEKSVADTDLLASLMNYKDENGEHLTDDQIVDNIIGVLFAAHGTTASLLTWILKYMHDDRNLLGAIRVIMESLRMASVVSYTFREAVEDVEYKGHLIPKGWKVLPLFRNVHHNPDFFSEPREFNPSRFEIGPKPNTFMPFGNGVHACPGSELAKLEMLVLLHHLVNEYRWEIIGPNEGVKYEPFPIPRNGLPAKFWKLRR